jgi:hypothetical protein
VGGPEQYFLERRNKQLANSPYLQRSWAEGIARNTTPLQAAWRKKCEGPARGTAAREEVDHA